MSLLRRVKTGFKIIGGAFSALYSRLAKWFGDVESRHSSISVAVRAGMKFKTDRMALPSAYFAYHSFLAIFPLLLLAGSVTGFILSGNPGLQSEVMEYIFDIFPDFGGTLQKSLEAMVNTRHIIGVIGFLGFLWTGSNIAKSLQAGISVIWGETPRKYFKRKLLSLGILLAIAAVVLVTILVNVGTSALGAFAAENFGFWWTVLGSMAGLAIDLTVNTTILSTVYYLAPQEKPGLRDVIRGALTTAVIFQVSRYAFGYYISSVSKSVLLYGTIGVFIGVLLWLYIIGAIVFYGAEIVRVLHTRKLRRTTQGPRDIEDAKPAL